MTFARTLAILQFGLAAISVVLHGLRPITLTGMIVGGAGIIVWALGAHALGAGNLNMQPDTLSNSPLVTRFPYSHIRHPMYTGLALLTMGLLISHPTYPAAVVWGALLVVLNGKATVEERTLEAEFKEYHAYRKQTRRFIPFVW